MSKYKNIWVFSENEALSLELLGKGRELADKLNQDLIGILIGSNQEENAQTLIDYGADIVHVITDPKLENFSVDIYTQVVNHLVDTYKPSILLIGATKSGRDLASRVAIRAGTGCVINCIGLDFNTENQLIMEREAYGGRAVTMEVCQTNPKIAAVSPKTFTPNERESRTGKIIEDTIELDVPKSQLIEFKEKEAGAELLTDAPIVILGGRGIRNKEDCQLLEDLASVLGGRVGWTRPLIEDLKWFPGTEWVGLSGQKIAPELCFSVGISGAIQYFAGVRGSKTTIAVNTDSNAPIFETSDYGVVGDLYEIIPALTEALKKYTN
ncbi:MAG: electron transfer flavoprotein subunit alpha/FixB family protein [Promethearchaeota archaeon]